MKPDIFARLPIGASIHKTAEDIYSGLFFHFDEKNPSKSGFVTSTGSTYEIAALSLIENVNAVKFLSN